MIQRLRILLSENKNFAFETTGAGTNYVKYLAEAQKKGYEIHLTYLWLSSPDLAVQRVAQRVAQGGHHIPEQVIRRRYSAGIKNLMLHYLPLADKAVILDNSSRITQLMVEKNRFRGSSMKKDINQLILEAHKRGVKLAIETSIRTGVPLVVEKNGKIIKIKPKYKYIKVPIKPKKKK